MRKLKRNKKQPLKDNLTDKQKAQKAAFNYLKLRPQSIGEMNEKLKKKGFSNELIKETIDFLIEYDFLNDQDFARAWIQSRLSKPLGVYRIKQELKQKRIDKDVIDSQLAIATAHYSELDVVIKLIEGRLARLREIEPQKQRRRLFDFLTRKGFSQTSIIKALEHYDWKRNT